MTLNYDTQIELLFPPALYDDSVCARLLRRVGIPMESSGNKILLLTDIRTVAALNAADEPVKNAFKASGIGLVVYGWSKHERVSFLLKALREIATKYAAADDALKLATFDLHRWVRLGMMNEIDPNPFAAPLPALRTGETFDIASALMILVSPEQMNKPKAPDHQLATRWFGRR